MSKAARNVAYSLPIKLAQIRYKLGLGNSSPGCGNDLIQADRHGKSQQLYGRDIETFVKTLSKVGNKSRQRNENAG